MSQVHLYLFFLVTAISSSAQAQKEATHWFFGEKAGFTFASGAPVAINNDTWYTYNACAVQSDPKTGDLLFYTNSEQVWNRNGEIMPNGNELNGSSSKTQACLIVPNPGDSQQYYLFTLANLNRANGYDNTLSYSMIDMRLNSGKGDVLLAQKNQYTDSDLSEKLTAIAHKNGQDFWIITHHWDGNSFNIYLLTANGLQKIREIAIGSAYTFSKDDGSNAGYMQASPNGTKLACAVFKVVQNVPNIHPVDLFDFDAQNGFLSNYINLGSLSRAYGVCFSPDNTKLYVSHQTSTPDSLYIDYIRQYDLTAGSDQDIINSGSSVIIGNPQTNIPVVERSKPSTGVNANFYAFALQNAPNGKMYGITFGGFCKVEDCRADYPHRFIVINRPNAKGFDCDIQLQTIDLRQGSISNAAGLPNFLQSTFNNLPPIDNPIANCNAAIIVVYPNPVSNYFYVQYKGDCFEPYRLQIVNLLGQRLFDTTVVSTESSAISTHNLSAGTYLIEVNIKQRKYTTKIVKK